MYFFWKVFIVNLSATIVEDMIIAFSILWVVFGTILLLNILKAVGAFEIFILINLILFVLICKPIHKLQRF